MATILPLDWNSQFELLLEFKFINFWGARQDKFLRADCSVIFTKTFDFDMCETDSFADFH